MLQSMRKNAKFFYFLFFMVIVTFVFWGVGGVDNGESPVVAKIGSETIMADEYWRAYERELNNAKDLYKDKLDAEMEKKLNLKEKVLNNLVDSRVLYRAADSFGIRIMDSELEQYIMQDPNFQQDGTFNKQVYLRVLEYNRISPKTYEQTLKRELAVSRVVQIIGESIDITPGESISIAGDEAAKQKLHSIIRNEKRQRAIASYIGGLKKDMTIKIYNDIIM